jgi:hypothetical protein
MFKEDNCYVCYMCGHEIVYESFNPQQVTTNRITLVGSGAASLRGKINSSSYTKEDKIVSIYNMLLKKTENLNIPGAILQEISERFVNVKYIDSADKEYGRHKNSQLAALLLKICKINTIDLNSKVVSELFKLNRLGLSKGNSIINAYVADEIMSFPIINEVDLEINIVIEEYKLEPETRAKLVSLIKAIYAVVLESRLCNNFTLRSKIIGITYVAMTKLGLIGTLKEYCIGMKKVNTVKKILAELNLYNSWFEYVFTLHKVNTGKV